CWPDFMVFVVTWPEYGQNRDGASRWQDALLQRAVARRRASTLGDCLRVEVARPVRLGPDLISGRLIKEFSRAGSGGRDPKDGVVGSGLFHDAGHDVLP